MHTVSAPTPIAELWRTARAWFAEALDVFGGPHTIRLTFSSSARRTIARQLQALETLAMKLLLIEAAALSPLTARTQAPRATRSKHQRAIPDPARPETWRVSFCLQIPPEPADKTAPRFRSLGRSRFIRAVVLDSKALTKKLARLSALRARQDSETHANAEKLARRCEALRRVFANPAPSARRLKRKLLALKQRSFDAATRIANSRPPRVNSIQICTSAPSMPPSTQHRPSPRSTQASAQHFPSKIAARAPKGARATHARRLNRRSSAPS